MADGSITYTVALYKSNGDYEDTYEGYDTLDEARSVALACAPEGGKSVIERREPLEEVTWTRKPKTRKL